MDLRAALTFFTRVPAGGVDLEAIRPQRVLLFGPLIGVVLAAAAALVGWALVELVGAPIAPLIAAVAAIASIAYLTRGLHLDGLADLADGLGSHRPPQESIAVMHRSDIGPFGVITLTLTLLLQISLLAGMIAAGYGWLGLAVALPAGRLAAVWLCRPGVPAAPGSKLGTWAARTVPVTVALVVTLLVLAGSAALSWWSAGSPDAAWSAAAAVAVACGCSLAIGAVAVRRFGGITGDVLGAAIELGQTAALLVLAIGML